MATFDPNSKHIELTILYRTPTLLMKNEVFSRLQTLVRALRSGSESSLLELYGRRPSKVEEILQVRELRRKQGQQLWMKDVLSIIKYNKKLFNIDDPRIDALAKLLVFYEDRFTTGKTTVTKSSTITVVMMNCCYDNISSIPGASSLLI